MTSPRCPAPIRTNGARHRADSPRRLTLPGTERVAAAVPTKVAQLRHLVDVPLPALPPVPRWAVALAGLGVGAALTMGLAAACDLGAATTTGPVSGPVSGPAVQLQPVDPRS